MNITIEPPKNCPQCGAEYRHIQAPHKPLGVSMMMVCDCTPIITNENGVTVTRLVSPKQLEHEKARAAALKKMLIALPYMRHAAKEASETGKVFIGILSVNDDGSGRVVARFEGPEFFDDLALVLGAPDQTEEDDMKAEAASLLDNLGLERGNP